MVGNTAMIELHSVLIPYQTDRPIELQAVATIVEQAWTRAGGSVTHPDFSPRSGCLPLLVLTGDWDEASETGAVILRLDWFTDAMSGAIARLERWRGNPELAREIIASRLTAGPHSPPGQLHYRTGLELQCVAAALALDDSDLELARRWLEAHDGWLDWSGTMLGRAESYLAWARWHRAAGNLEQSATYVKRALADTREPRQPLALIGAHRLLGELEADLGRYDVSEKHLKESLSLAEACAAPYEQARTYHALAMLAHARGETDAAMQRAEEAREICTRLGAQLLLARIDELQAVLNSDSAVALPAGITQREVEVLRLAAQGFDNAAIAEQLFISAHTVHRHMANILTKLDLPTRTAAVAWALRHDLL
jgi:ATP/maltotriose-dependent transcriptional regulator MalT